MGKELEEIKNKLDEIHKDIEDIMKVLVKNKEDKLKEDKDKRERRKKEFPDYKEGHDPLTIMEQMDF